MATAVCDGIVTRYEVLGSGPPLLMFSPGGFDATIEKWSTQSIYAKVKPLDHLSRHYTCIVFDRRECGQSGGRVESIGWKHYVAQAKGLLDHLGIDRAHMMGGCMGCSPVTTFAVSDPKRVASMILWWPVGGEAYRKKANERFGIHIDFAKLEGLQKVVDLARSEGKSFGADPRVGPWAAPIRTDDAFAESYAKIGMDFYETVAGQMFGKLFVSQWIESGNLTPEAAPGPTREKLARLDVPTLIVPGDDESHATSAARFLSECIPGAKYWDAKPEAQTAEAAAPRLLEFLESASKA